MKYIMIVMLTVCWFAGCSVGNDGSVRQEVSGDQTLYIESKDRKHGCYVDLGKLQTIEGLDDFYSDYSGKKLAIGDVTMTFKDGVVVVWKDGNIIGDPDGRVQAVAVIP